ncbi:MAG TPA: hypothetical protein VFQ51_07915 [Vicinamibacteria bacterium]|nr:hypothetical protein [Vicinamibacteria bacterium]
MKLVHLAVAVALAAPAAAQGAAPAAAPAASPKALSNTIKWSTASEVENFGYDVFRGDKEEGPFTKLNSRIIAGAGTVDEPRYYQYVDETIEAGKEYWYYVESVSLSGTREKFTPVFRSKAKDAEGKVIASPSAEAPAVRPSPHTSH